MEVTFSCELDSVSQVARCSDSERGGESLCRRGQKNECHYPNSWILSPNPSLNIPLHGLDATYWVLSSLEAQQNGHFPSTGDATWRSNRSDTRLPRSRYACYIINAELISLDSSEPKCHSQRSRIWWKMTSKMVKDEGSMLIST